jgi:hypothetical protein
MTALPQVIIGHLEQQAPKALAFWTADRVNNNTSVLEACDVLYTLTLGGHTNLLAADSGTRFAWMLSRHRLAGGIGHGEGRKLSVHLSAYVLGALNLLMAHNRPGHEEALRKSGWRISELVEPRTARPRWPRHLSHHAWRVSHWIGGIPSIIKSLWSLVPDLAARNHLPTTETVLKSSDAIIDPRSGLLRPYRFELLQQLFRILYSLRHDPDAADIGGIAHLHWVNYVDGRLPYKASSALFEHAWRVLQREPFMESVPYCLDFDVVQIARTSLPDCENRREQFRKRADIYSKDLTEFYLHQVPEDYALHKFPGGLATLHECALAMEQPVVPSLNIEPIDIIKGAHWI